MFIYKYCPKCKKRNHKANNHCVRCGDKLTTAERFGKDVFVITLSLIVLFSSVSVFASRSYFNNQPKNSTPTIEEPKPIDQNNIAQQSPVVEAQPVKTPVPETPVPKTNTKTNSAPKPTSTPQPVAEPVKTCDDFKKQTLITQENIRYQQELASEEQRHQYVLAPLYDAQNRCGNRVGGLCDTWGTDLFNENNLHDANDARILAEHNKILAEMSNACY